MEPLDPKHMKTVKVSFRDTKRRLREKTTTDLRMVTKEEFTFTNGG
jgi:hypothetical protein